MCGCGNSVAGHDNNEHSRMDGGVTTAAVLMLIVRSNVPAH